MMFRKVGDKRKFNFLNDLCIGRECWAPGAYQHRAPTGGGGSRNTGSPDSMCCLNRAYWGCPAGPSGERTKDCGQCEDGRIQTAPAGAGHSDDLAEYVPCQWCGGIGIVTIRGVPIYSKELATKRKAEGWKKA